MNKKIRVDISVEKMGSLEKELKEVKQSYLDFAYDLTIVKLVQEILKYPKLEYIEISIRSRTMGDYALNQFIVNEFPPPEINNNDHRIDYFGTILMNLPVELVFHTNYFQPFKVYPKTAMFDLAKGLMGEDLGKEWYAKKQAMELTEKLKKIENKAPIKINKI